MPYTDYVGAICHKLQNAAAAFIAAGNLISIPPSSVYSGIRGGQRNLPCVACLCKSAQQETFPDGNWSADLVVRVSVSANDTSEDTFHEIAGEVYSLFLQAPSDVADQLSNSEIGIRANFVVPQSQSWDLLSDDKTETWESELSLMVKCFGRA